MPVTGIPRRNPTVSVVSGKHDWDTFQAEHDLADRTIEELQQFGDGDPVRLADLSMSMLEEIKEVPDLESSLELVVRS